MRRFVGALAIVLAVVGCGKQQAVPLVPATGPPQTIRVAVTTLGDPTIARNVVGLGHKPAFRVIDAGPRHIVGVRPGLRLEFVRMKPYAAAVAFRRARVDVAPVPLGDLEAVRRDPALRGSVHVRPLLGLDLVRLDASIPVAVRRFLWLSADRDEYRQLVPENAASNAYGLLRSAPPVERPSLRELKQRAKELRARVPGTWVRLASGYEAELLAAFWREAGASVLVTDSRPNARFERVIAPYVANEALFVALRGRRSRQQPLARLDRALRKRAEIVPIAWVAGAKLVSRRLAGWSQDVLGQTDYSRVRIRAR